MTPSHDLSTPTPARAAASTAPELPPAWTGALELSADEFQRVARLIYAAAGISLPSGKEGLVRARLGPRLRQHGLSSVTDYLAFVEADRTGQERVRLVDVLTTNKTSFFREAEHFHFMASAVLPPLEARWRASRTAARVWSAGCSSGEEPYTIAMVLRERLGAEHATAARILATDISTRVLDRARAATYTSDAVADIPRDVAARHLKRAAGAGAGTAASPGDRLHEVVPATRALVRFAHLNLMGDWPMRGPFDVIFCRNVMIYFDRPTQERLVQRFASLLAPGGYLLVGHSESLNALSHPLAYVQPAVYMKR